MNQTNLIRIAGTADALAIAEIYAPYVRETSGNFETEAPGPMEMAHRIGLILQTHPWLVCEVNGVVAGYAYASAHRAREAYRWSAECSVYLSPAFHGKKIGSALYQALFGILRYQGFRNVYAGIGLPNEGSVSFHRSSGFGPVGIYHKIGYKHGAWRDVQWWEFRLSGDEEPPETVTKFSEIIDNQYVKEILFSASHSFTVSG